MRRHRDTAKAAEQADAADERPRFGPTPLDGIDGALPQLEVLGITENREAAQAAEEVLEARLEPQR